MANEKRLIDANEMRMYRSPIEIIYGQMETQIEGDILRAVQKYGINVDKEELIRALKYDRDQYEKGYDDAMADHKWIPVAERLPEKEGTYLTYTEKERIHLDCFCIYPNHGTQFWVCGNGKVTHWMPLPEPPKGE